MTDRRFYVYIHKSDKTGLPFYVGKGSYRRAGSPNGRNSEWKIVAEAGWSHSIPYSELPEICAFCIERIFIDHLPNLVNSRSGGASGWSSPKGWFTKLRMSSSTALKWRDPAYIAAHSGPRKHEKHVVVHPDFGRIEATRYELVKHHGFSSSAASSLIKGTYKSWRGWRIDKPKTEAIMNIAA